MRDLARQIASSTLASSSIANRDDDDTTTTTTSARRLLEDNDEEEEAERANAEEDGAVSEEAIAARRGAKFAQTLDFVARTLAAENAVERKRYLFILDEFESFAGKTKQSFLYGLLDLAHRPELGRWVPAG